jgi:hypothetical protein
VSDLTGMSNTLRSTALRKYAAYVSCLGLVLLTIGLVGLSGAYPLSGSVGGYILGTFDVSGGIAVLAWALFRVAQMGVRFGDEGVIVRNWFRTVSLLWRDIDSFRFGDELKNLSLRESLNTPDLQPYVVLRDGRHIPLVGLAPTRYKRKQSRATVQYMLDSLNRLARTHRDA